jgi:HK97 family phage major capsid protein
MPEEKKESGPQQDVELKLPLDDERAVWSTAFINKLPDAAFAVIEPGGEKDEEGKTVPRSLRHLPHHGPNVKSPGEHTSVDRPHLANALSRLPQTRISAELKAKAEAHLRRHVAALQEDERGVEQELSRAVSFDMRPEELQAKREALLAGEPLRLGILRRDAGAAAVTNIDGEKRTVRLTFSSEQPVERWFGTEVLDHSPGSVRLDRIRRGGALLLNHNLEKHVGVVEDVGIGTDRRGWADVRFGRSALAEETLQDVQDGIRRNVSIGYRVYRLRREKRAPDDKAARGVVVPAGAGGGDLQFRAVDWGPLEISLMSVAEDCTVGVGRSAAEDEQLVEIEGVEIETRSGEESSTETTVEHPREDREESREMEEKEIKAMRDEERKAERDRISAILAVGKKHDQEELAHRFVEESRGVDEFNAAVLEAISNRDDQQVVTRGAPEESDQEQEGQNPAYLGMPEKDVKRYSLFRAIQAYLDKDWTHAGLEHEASKTLADRLNRAPQGFFVPNDVMVDPSYLTRGLTRAAFLQLQRTLEIGGGAGAEPLRGTEHLAGSFIELLRNRMVVTQAGARTMDGLVGDQDFPRQTGGATAAWVAEGGAPGVSDPTFDTITASPKTVGAATGMTRRALKQTSPAVESVVRDDLNRVVAIAIDTAALRGTGAGNNQPQGVVGATGVGDVEFGPAGAAATWAKVIEFETDVADANADYGSLAYVTTPKGRGHLKSKAVDPGAGVFMWDRDNTVNGYRAFATKNLRDDRSQGGGSNLTEVLYGNWVDLIICLWGAFDLKPDEATLVTSGGLVLRAFQDVDVVIRHGASFSYSNDLNAAA